MYYVQKLYILKKLIKEDKKQTNIKFKISIFYLSNLKSVQLAPLQSQAHKNKIWNWTRPGMDLNWPELESKFPSKSPS